MICDREVNFFISLSLVACEVDVIVPTLIGRIRKVDVTMFMKTKIL